MNSQYLKKISILALSFSLCSSFAQAVPLTDYAVYSATSVDVMTNVNINAPVGTPGLLEFASGSIVDGFLATGGNLVAGTNITVNGDTVVGGNAVIASGADLLGKVDIGGTLTTGTSILATGAVTAGGETFFASGSQLNSNVLVGNNLGAGLNVNFLQNVGVNGNIDFGTATQVVGTATHTGTLTLNGTASVGASVVGPSVVNPAPFVPSALPPATAFIAGGATVNTDGIVLAPGSYGNVDFGTTKGMTLVAGDYFFTDFNAASGFDLVFDLSLGAINIFVDGNIKFGTSLDIFFVGAPVSDVAKAELIYTELTGDFDMASGGFWFGTIFASSGYIDFGNNIDLVGSLYAEDFIQIGSGSNIIYAVSDFFPRDNDTAIPEPSTLLLLGMGSALAIRKRARGRLT